MDITASVLDRGYWISSSAPYAILKGLCGHSKCRENTFATNIEEVRIFDCCVDIQVQDLSGLGKVMEDSIGNEVPVDMLLTLLKSAYKVTFKSAKSGISLPARAQ